MSAQKLFEARIISLMPIVIILFLNISSPDYLAPMYGNIAGGLLMTAALASTALGYYAMTRINKVKL